MSNHTNSESQLGWSPLIRYCCLPTMAKSDDCLGAFILFLFHSNETFIFSKMLAIYDNDNISQPPLLLYVAMYNSGTNLFFKKYLFIWLHQVLVSACRI